MGVKKQQLEPCIEQLIGSGLRRPAAAKSLQLCPTLCNPIDGSLPGSFVHGIFQARVLEWGAIAFSENTLDGTKRNGSVKSSRKIPVQHNHQHFPGQKGSVSGIFHCPKDFPVSSHSPVVVPEFE